MTPRDKAIDPSSEFAPEQLYPTGRYSHIGEHLRILARDKSAYVPPARPGVNHHAFDAIIMPTGRKVKHTKRNLIRTMELAQKHKPGIVLFLCSHDTDKQEVARIAISYPEQRWAVVDMSTHNTTTFNLSSRQTYISQRSDSDLSDKRNFSLELAKLMDWKKVMFVDDDVYIEAGHLDKAASLLEEGAQVAGFSVKKFPDHSVAIHANQLVNSHVDSFIGGGVLAVKTSAPLLPFFPHLYNDDWLFALVYSLGSEDSLVWAGTVDQKAYRPFHKVDRAEREEPGDILAEGLFRLVMDIKSDRKAPKATAELLELLAQKADITFWQKEINDRLVFLRATQEKVQGKKLLPRKRAIIASLQQSIGVINGHGGIGGLRADDFAGWVKAWTADLETWNKHIAGLKQARSFSGALNKAGAGSQYIYNHGTVRAPGYIPGDKTSEHMIHGYLGLASPARRALAIRGHNSTAYLQEFVHSNSHWLGWLAQSSDALRRDRPLSQVSSEPYMTVAMLVRYNEPLEDIRKSVRYVVSHAQEGAPIQILLWVHSNKTNRRSLGYYRDTVTMQLVTDLQNTNVRLSSALVARSGSGTDSIVDSALTDTLFAYWKEGIQLDHYFVVVNSSGQALRHGTREQFMRHEHGIADRPLGTYLQRPELVRETHAPYTDATELAASRQRFGDNSNRTLALKRGFREIANTVHNFVLGLLLRRAGLSWLQLDDLAHTVEFHHGAGWSSIHNVQTVLAVVVGFKEGLPSDTHATVRSIAAAIAKESDRIDGGFGCMLVIHGKPSHTWEQLQAYRQTITRMLGEQQNAGFILTSLIYRQTVGTSPRKSQLTIKALVRYIYWLENHRIRQQFSWSALGDGAK